MIPWDLFEIAGHSVCIFDQIIVHVLYADEGTYEDKMVGIESTNHGTHLNLRSSQLLLMVVTYADDSGTLVATQS